MPLLKSKRFWILLFFIFLGVVRGILWKPVLPSISLDKTHDVCGTVAIPFEIYPNGQKVILESLSIDGEKIWGKLDVFLDKKFQRYFVGNQICFMSVIKSIRNFGTPGEFDFERYASSQNIWGKCFLRKKDSIILNPHKVFYPIESLREQLELFLEKYPSGPVLKALILGIKSNLSKSLEEDFIKSGLIHLLVISGQNVGLLLIFSFSLFYWILSRFEFFLLYFNIQRILIFISIIFTVFFYFFSGRAIPVLRATLMSYSFLLSLWNSRFQSGFYSLCWSAALILNFIPSSLKDPSFQLSFAATFGLIGLMALLSSVKSYHKILFWIFSSIVSMAVTLPLLLYHFHRISLISVISNLVVVPYVSFILLPFSFLLSAMYFCFEPLASLFMVFLNPLIQFFVQMAHFFASFSWSTFYFITPIFFEMILWYAGILNIGYFCFSKRYFKAFGMGICFLFIFVIHFQIESILKSKNQNLCLSFLSVGQGDSAFIEFPHGKNMLIDGGGLYGFEVGERIIAPYLWKKRILHIDTLILSHSDFDHVGGLPFILKHFSVSKIWLSQWTSKNKVFYNILHLAEQKNIPCYLISRKPPSLKIEDVELRFLSPTAIDIFEQEKTNNLSMVFRLQYKNFSALFTGDIEKEIEERLGSDPIQATILKVPHHGSKTSSSQAFLKKVFPQWAVMSLGWQNRYHFPHSKILETYQKLKIPIWRTDLQGTLEIKTDGKNYCLNCQQ